MSNEQKWLNEVMSQNAEASTGKDYTRLALNFCFIKHNLFSAIKPIDIIYKFIYRFYIDNYDLAKMNPYPIIRNIYHYKPENLKGYCLEQLMIWKKEKESLLNFNNEEITIEGDITLNDEFLKKYKFIIDIMFNKFLGKKFWYDEDENLCDINYITNDQVNSQNNTNIKNNINDAIAKFNINEYLEVMKHSKLRNRMFEKLNYCPLCDEFNHEKLNLIHLKNYKECNEEELHDINNTLLLCESHCIEYLSNDFKFKPNGYIEIINKREDLDKRMHIGVDILNEQRKRYISN